MSTAIDSTKALGLDQISERFIGTVSQWLKERKFIGIKASVSSDKGLFFDEPDAPVWRLELIPDNVDAAAIVIYFAKSREGRLQFIAHVIYVGVDAQINKIDLADSVSSRQILYDTRYPDLWPEQSILDLLQAVSDGNLNNQVTLCRGRIIGHSSTVILPKGEKCTQTTFVGHRTGRLLQRLGLGDVRYLNFEPWRHATQKLSHANAHDTK